MSSGNGLLYNRLVSRVRAEDNLIISRLSAYCEIPTVSGTSRGFGGVQVSATQGSMRGNLSQIERVVV